MRTRVAMAGRVRRSGPSLRVQNAPTSSSSACTGPAATRFCGAAGVEGLQRQFVRYQGQVGATQTQAGWLRPESDTAMQHALADPLTPQQPPLTAALPQQVQLSIKSAPADFCLPIKKLKRFKPSFQVEVRPRAPPLHAHACGAAPVDAYACAVRPPRHCFQTVRPACVQLRVVHSGAVRLPVRVKAFVVHKWQMDRVHEWLPEELQDDEDLKHTKSSDRKGRLQDGRVLSCLVTDTPVRRCGAHLPHQPPQPAVAPLCDPRNHARASCRDGCWSCLTCAALWAACRRVRALAVANCNAMTRPQHRMQQPPRPPRRRNHSGGSGGGGASGGRARPAFPARASLDSAAVAPRLSSDASLISEISDPTDDATLLHVTDSAILAEFDFAALKFEEPTNMVCLPPSSRHATRRHVASAVSLSGAVCALPACSCAQESAPRL